MDHPIVFFDGVCNLCNGFIDWLMRHDRGGRFRVASLQGETAQTEIPVMAADLNSIVLRNECGIYTKSDAVVGILRGLPRWRVLGGALRLIPRPIRDGGYGFIARHRYRWFGKRDSCRLPTAEERGRFLP